MIKGTVISVEESMASVMTEDCRVVRIPVHPGIVIGKEITMKKKEEKTVNPTASKKRIAFLVAAAVLLIVGGAVLAQYIIGTQTEYARISVDVNPSVEFTIARNLKVLSVEAMNEDAEAYLEGKNYAGMPWDEAVEDWIATLRAGNHMEMNNVLISGVFPEDAERIREQLMLFENQGETAAMEGLNVRVIYSNDSAVKKQAQGNELSVGRQMLLNQSKVQNKEWNEQNIAKAGLGELVGALLGDKQQDQTRINERLSESSGQGGDPTGEGATVTNQEQNGEPNNGEGTAQETNREQNRETEGSALQSGSTLHEGGSEPAGSTQRETAQNPGGN